MAEGALFNLATDILKRAGSIAFSEIRLLCVVRDELNSLMETAQTIEAGLLDAEKPQRHNHQIELWLAKLKDVLYDVQDLLDDVATEDLRRKVTPGNKMLKEVRVFFSRSNQLAYRFKVAKKIQELRKRLDRIENNKKLHLEHHPSGATVAIARSRATHSFLREEKIIGRQIDKERIIKSLLDSSKKCVSVVSIVGMGGLGKTTLARLVYNDDNVRNCFELEMWAWVSDVFDEDFLIKEILKSARGKCEGDPEMARNLQDIDNKCKDELQGLLRRVLDGKKYLLVLDDLWNEDHGKWLELQDLLMGGSQGSKILVTTRNQSVVQAMDTNSVIHYLEILSEGESWDLFKRTAFGDGAESLNQKLEETGQDIVKKCGGVPLAIKTIGNLLYAKEEKEWLYFKEHEFSKIDTSNPGIMEVLKISYNHLPLRLKRCFKYFALFPNDYPFNKMSIIQQWIAQGEIESSNGNEELEEIGYGYLSHLLCRSFLELEKVDPFTGELQTFKIHHLMRDLALEVAGNEFKMVSRSIDEATRHASFDLQSSSMLEVTSLLKATNLRTVLSFQTSFYRHELSPNECHQIFSKFRCLRMLGLYYVDFCITPSMGSQLKHLRFLEIHYNESMKSLPDSITDLVNLQFLTLSRCLNLQTFPRDMRKLVNLRHLTISVCLSLSHLPPLSELPSLRTLGLLMLNDLEFLEQTSDLKQFNTTRPFFPSLEKLTLSHCPNLKGWWGKMQAHQTRRLDNSLISFPKLRSVVIRGCPLLNFIPPFPQVEHMDIDSMKLLEQLLLTNPNCLSEPAVGSTFNPFSKLKHLYLVGGDLEPLILETLFQLARNLESITLKKSNLRGLSCGMQHLPSLQKLSIYLGEGLDFLCQEDEQGTQWQFLTKLQISYLHDLVALPKWIQHATTLQSLEISDCQRLRSLPEWIGNLSLLEKIVLSNCPSLERLPFERHNFTHLKELRIIDCPNLEERCVTDARVPVIVWGDESERLAR